MVINIAPLAEGKVLDFNFSENIQLDSYYNLQDNNIKIKINGTVSKQGTLYTCTADAMATVHFSCDKCLKETTRVITFPIVEKFSNVEYLKTNDEEEVHLFYDSQILLKDWVMSSLSSNMPMVVLCEEDCKGLCPVCGHNLNLGSCKCDNVVFDTRFEALRSLFKDDKEV